MEILFQPDRVDQLIDIGGVAVDGDPEVLRVLVGLLDTFDPAFPIVTPVER